MKPILKLLLILFFFSATNFAQNNDAKNFFQQVNITVKNPADIKRIDELISISVNELQIIDKKFNQDAFIVYGNNEEIPSQLINKKDSSYIVFVADFESSQKKVFLIKYLDEGKLRNDYPSRTYSEIAMKLNATHQDKKYSGDRFVNFTEVVIPEIHTDHDELFKYEGSGWESDKVGYRLYQDWRNTTDIFGKKVEKIILNQVGTKEALDNGISYHEMQSWGMDILKVGESLGIGSIGMMNEDTIEKVSNTEKVTCEIPFNGPIISSVRNKYYGWKVGDNIYDLVSNMSIAAGSRLTKVELEITQNPTNIVTGLVKHDGVEYIASTNDDANWKYIACYGIQSLANDYLGMVVFYNESCLIQVGEDDINYFVSLKPNINKVQYYFAAAWEQELNGIKTKKEFVEYLDSEIIKLNNPMQIELSL